MIELSVIIVTYNSAAHIEACLAALADGSSRDAWEITVVDNASQDGTVGIVAKRFPGVRVLRNPRNLGLARAINMGIRRSRGRYVAGLNPDVVVSRGALREMMRLLDVETDVAAVGCRLIYPDGTTQHSCRSFPTPLTILFRRTPLQRIFPRAKVLRDHLMTGLDRSRTHEVDWLLGACVVARRVALEQVGLLDEGYFLYCEDVDLCRGLWQAGWRVIYYPAVCAEHHYARESAHRGLNRLSLQHARSMWRYLCKHRQWNPLTRSNPRLDRGHGGTDR